jgi:integrase
MKNARGLGNVYQPTYRDRQGALKHTSTWWLVYHVNGKRIAENAHTTNRAEAVRLLKKRTGDAALGKPVGPQVDKTTLDDLVAMVEADYKANSRRSLDRVQDAATHLRAFFRGERKAREISPDRVTAYQAQRLDQGAASSSVNYEVAVIRRGFHLAYRAGKVAMRPEFAMLHVDNARTGFFERDQFDAVLPHLPDYLKSVLTAAYITGWRTNSELLTRQWRHVDLEHGWLRLEPGETKNGDGREFPFTPELRTLLEAQRLYVDQLQRATGQIIPWVFPHPAKCGRFTAGSRIKDFRGAWDKARKNAGLPGKVVHDFRRTAVRNLERAGVPRSAAMKLTGHRTEAVYRRYAITDSAMLQEAAAKLATLHAADVDAQKQNRKSRAKVDHVDRAFSL